MNKISELHDAIAKLNLTNDAGTELMVKWITNELKQVDEYAKEHKAYYNGTQVLGANGLIVYDARRKNGEWMIDVKIPNVQSVRKSAVLWNYDARVKLHNWKKEEGLL